MDTFGVVLAKRNQLINCSHYIKFDKENIVHENAYQGKRELCQSSMIPFTLVDIDNSNNNAALLAEVCLGHTENCKYLIDHGSSVDKVGCILRSPLFYAAYVGNIEICELLITCGAEVDEKDSYERTLLFYAAHRGNTDICKVLIRLGASVDAEDYKKLTPLFMAVFDGHFTTCKLLVSQG